MLASLSKCGICRMSAFSQFEFCCFQHKVAQSDICGLFSPHTVFNCLCCHLFRLLCFLLFMTSGTLLIASLLCSIIVRKKQLQNFAHHPTGKAGLLVAQRGLSASSKTDVQIRPGIQVQSFFWCFGTSVCVLVKTWKDNVVLGKQVHLEGLEYFLYEHLFMDMYAFSS